MIDNLSDALARIAVLEQGAADRQAELDAANAGRADAITAAVAAAVAPLQSQVAALTAQLAGSAGSYRVSVTALHAAALAVEQAVSDTDPAGWINATLYAALRELSLRHQGAILTAALGRYPSLPDPDRGAVLGALGLSYLSPLPVPDQLDALAGLALPRFQALDPATQNAIVARLGL